MSFASLAATPVELVKNLLRFWADKLKGYQT